MSNPKRLDAPVMDIVSLIKLSLSISLSLSLSLSLARVGADELSHQPIRGSGAHPVRGCVYYCRTCKKLCAREARGYV